MQRLEYLDGLRGFAICGVVLIHVGQLFTGLPAPVEHFAAYGYRGVQLFFIVSAFTLTGTLVGRVFRPGEFYLKRFLRIAPMFYLAIVAYLLVDVDGAPSTPLDAALTVLFLHGLAPSSINSVVPGGWSIATEAMFYASLPALLVWITSLPRALVALAVSAVLALASRVAIPALLAGHAPAASIEQFVHFGFLNNLPALILGIVVFYALRDPLALRVAPMVARAGLAACLVALTVIGLTNIGPLRQPIIAAGFLAGVLFFTALAPPRVIDNRVLRHIGTVSFSIYLIHFAILHFGHGLADRLGDSVAALVATYVVTLVVSTVLASLTYRFIELPAIELGRRVSGRMAERRIASTLSPAS